MRAFRVLIFSAYFFLFPFLLFGVTLRISWIYPQGTAVTDLVLQYFSELEDYLQDIDFEIVHQSNDRSIKSLEYGMTDGDFARSVYVYEEIDHVLMIPVPIIETLYLVCTRDESITADRRTWDGKTLIGVRGDQAMVKIARDNNRDDLLLFDNTIQVLQALEKERGDFTILPLQVAEELKRSAFENSGIVLHNEPVLIVPLYFFLHERHEVLVDPITEAIEKMRDSGRTDKIFGSREKL